MVKEEESLRSVEWYLLKILKQAELESAYNSKLSKAINRLPEGIG